jgi:RNA-directed DNA polymerase
MKLFDATSNLELARLLKVAPDEITQVIAARPRYYRSWKERKSDGSFRIFMAPNGPLKLLQQKVKGHVLDSIPVLDCVHGWVVSKSVQTNAFPHTRKAVVFSIDIQDFYPSIKPHRVQRIFEAMGFGPETADILTRITTWNGELPQGSPSSSALANLSLTRVDVRLRPLAMKNGLSYTRYGDDLTLSGNARLLGFRGLIRRIVEEEGFSINPNKVRTMRAGSRQTVTKLVVNERINLPREKRTDLRRRILKLVSSRGLHLSIRG